jgi:hypothetical protein
LIYNGKGKTIVKQFRSSLKDDTGDIHAKLMSRYREAPEWWYVYSVNTKDEESSLSV